MTTDAINRASKHGAAAVSDLKVIIAGPFVSAQTAAAQFRQSVVGDPTDPTTCISQAMTSVR